MKPLYCRHKLESFDEHGMPRLDYCGKRIANSNALDWCPECMAALPYWPQQDPVPC